MMVLVAPTVTEEGLPAVVERVGSYVTDQGGEVESATYENPWGRRRLAYPIQNFNDAYYILYYFTVAPRGVDEIERMVRLDDVIIRHLIVKYDPLSERYQRQGMQVEQTDEDGADEVEREAEPVAAGVATEAAPAESAVAVESEEVESEAETAEPAGEDPATASVVEEPATDDSDDDEVEDDEDEESKE